MAKRKKFQRNSRQQANMKTTNRINKLNQHLEKLNTKPFANRTINSD